jgi:CheY-like chemotaxis protein
MAWMDIIQLGLIREREKALDKLPVPIIAMTANAFLTDRDKCIQAGMSDYISKPFKPEELKEKLIKLIKEIA